MGMSDERKGALFLIVIAAILVAAIVIVGFSIRTDTVSDTLASDQVVRILFVVENESGGVLFSDMLIYYPISGRAVLVGVPGNTGQIFTSIGRTDRIDAVYSERGIDVYKSEIDSLLDTNTPFTVVIKISDFVTLVDLLGGMKVFVPEPVDVTGENGIRYLLPSGAVTLDGDKIATYLSYRLDTDSDATVQERYQNIIISFFAALNEKRSVIFSKNNFRLYREHIQVNLDYDNSYSLFLLLADLKSENIITQTITGTIRKVGEKTLLFPLNNGLFIKQAVSQMTNMIVSDSGTAGGRVYVLAIQNGTAIQGLARNASILFGNAGYEVLNPTNADRNDYDETFIINHIGNRDAALMVGSFIRCANIKDEDVSVFGNVADVDFTIVLGRDFDGRYVR